MSLTVASIQLRDILRKRGACHPRRKLINFVTMMSEKNLFWPKINSDEDKLSKSRIPYMEISIDSYTQSTSHHESPVAPNLKEQWVSLQNRQHGNHLMGHHDHRK